MSEDDLMCIHCGWIGHRQELVCTEDDGDNFIYCPDCKESDGLESEDS